MFPLFAIVFTWMNKMKLWYVSLILFLPLSSATMFGQRSTVSDTGKTPSLDVPGYESLVVADVGKKTISAHEFLMNYTFGPAFPKREKDSKRRYLDFMIYEKLLALEGYAKGLDKTQDATLSLAEMRGDLATEELYKNDILGKIQIAEQDIQRGIQDEQTMIDVKWIFARDQERIDDIVRSLKDRAAFDSLFALQLKGAVKEDDRQMEISKFKLSLKNPLLSHLLDTLKPEKISSPVKAPDGWYLFTTVHGYRQPMITQSEEMKLREDVVRALTQHKADSLSDLYVRTMMTQYHPTIVRRSLDIVYSHLAKQLLTQIQFAEWKIDERFSERWNNDRYDTITKRVQLVELEGKNYSAIDFLDWYRAREVNIHLTMTSPELLYSSLEQLVWRMIRDKLLTDRALTRGFQHRATVKRQLAWWKDKIVYNLEKASITDSLRINDTLLTTYYSEHTQRFRDTTGRVLPFEQTKDNVRREYVSYEVTKRTMHKILALKERYHVNVHEQVLDGVAVDTENDPKAIDVYVAKTGGIFPRPAFPTIDVDWQLWN